MRSSRPPQDPYETRDPENRYPHNPMRHETQRLETTREQDSPIRPATPNSVSYPVHCFVFSCPHAGG